MNSLWAAYTPVSMTYVETPAPAPARVIRPSSGSARWSARSKPHDCAATAGMPTPTGVTSFDTADTGLVPTAFVAVTVKV